MRSLHWSVHPNGTLEVDVHGLDAVELRGVEDGAGGDDALGDAIRPRRALRASQRFPLRAKSSRQARGRPQYGSAFTDDHSGICCSDTAGLRSSTRASR